MLEAIHPSIHQKGHFFFLGKCEGLSQSLPNNLLLRTKGGRSKTFSGRCRYLENELIIATVLEECFLCHRQRYLRAAQQQEAINFSECGLLWP